MSRLNGIILVFLILVVVTPVTAQETHIADDAVLQKLLEKKLDEDAADRAAVGKLFQRPEVQVVAGKLGLSASHMEAASAILDGDELRLLASYSRSADEDLVGGLWGGPVTWVAIVAVIGVTILLFAIAG